MDAPPTPKAAGKGLAAKLKGHKPVVYIGAAGLGVVIFFYVRSRQAAQAVATNPTDSTGTAPDDSTSVYPDDSSYPIQYSGGYDPGAFNGSPYPSSSGSDPNLLIPDGFTVIYDQDGTAHLTAIPTTPTDVPVVPVPGTGTTPPGMGGGGPPVSDPGVHLPPSPAPAPAPVTPAPSHPALPSGWSASNSYWSATRNSWYRIIQRPSASHNNALSDYRQYANDPNNLIYVGPVGHS